MEGAAALQRIKLEKRLAYLATVGNNAPFIGLFGTVIGIVEAFKALSQAQVATDAVQAAKQSLAPAAVMGSISEALVATAIGIAVAIPAVAANNYFQRATRRVLANTEALSKVLLAHMKADPDYEPPAPKASRGRSGGEAKPSSPGKKRSKKSVGSTEDSGDKSVGSTEDSGDKSDGGEES
jgi:biopolymer transport protein ExbB